MGTCGFWTLAFCIEAAKCESYNELVAGCKSGIIFQNAAKRMSIIIDCQDSFVGELESYAIPINSVCISKESAKLLGLERTGARSEHCTKLRTMMIAAAPSVSRGTGKALRDDLSSERLSDEPTVPSPPSGQNQEQEQNPPTHFSYELLEKERIIVVKPLNTKIFKDIEKIRIRVPSDVDINQEYMDNLQREILSKGFNNDMIKLDNVTMKRSGVEHYEKMGKFVNDRIIANYRRENGVYKSAGGAREI
jgi:hypothetical protein